MFKGAMFIAGLTHFLIAHIFYILACAQTGIPSNYLILFALILIALIFLFSIWKALGKLLLPVLAYILVITSMLYFAFGLYTTSDNTQGNIVLAAAVLFVISDYLLAVYKFQTPFKWAQPLIYLTYFPAQTLFAWSLAL